MTWLLMMTMTLVSVAAGDGRCESYAAADDVVVVVDEVYDDVTCPVKG